MINFGNSILDCGNVPQIDFGTLTLEDPANSTYGAAASVNCDIGFVTLNGTVFCLDTGQWDNATCSAKGKFAY